MAEFFWVSRLATGMTKTLKSSLKLKKILRVFPKAKKLGFFSEKTLKKIIHKKIVLDMKKMKDINKTLTKFTEIFFRILCLISCKLKKFLGFSPIWQKRLQCFSILIIPSSDTLNRGLIFNICILFSTGNTICVIK